MTDRRPARHPCASRPPMTRRAVLKAGGLGVGAVLAGPAIAGHADKPAPPARRPNLLLILCDQLGLDAIGAHGFPDARTPNLDRLIRRGTTFRQTHSTSPVCSPARSSILTGCMPVETGVVSNGRPIHPSRPNLGQWLGRHGYETVYCGKWHLPGGYQPRIEGFGVLPSGGGQGDLNDTAVSNACAAWIGNRPKDKPYLMVASFMQPHDICYWGNARGNRMPEGLGLPFERLRGRLPKLPPNHTVRPEAPARLDARICKGFSEDMWRYYLWLYARMIEMLDADVGRVLDAVEAAGEADSTIVLFTSDHGDGRGRHMHVSKWYPYEEAVKVPLVVACPGRIAEGAADAAHLVCGLDVMPTFCDYAGVAPPEVCRGRSLRPLLEGRDPAWRKCVVAEWMGRGRMVRTERHKYVVDGDDPVEMLFDMQADPWETKNLYRRAELAGVLAEHRRLLGEFESGLAAVEPTRDFSRPAPKARPRKKGKAL